MSIVRLSSPVRRAYALTDILVMCGAVLVFGSLAQALVVGGGPSSVREAALRARDSGQMRGIAQGLILWSMNNKEAYPLPSAMDVNDFTVVTRGPAKNTSANTMSILVFNGLVPCEMLVSPTEIHPTITVDDNYNNAQPESAVKPENALWDPSFRADFSNGGEGNLSYAHLQPSSERRGRWANTMNASQVILATRGPEVRDVLRHDDGGITPSLAMPGNMAMHLWGDGVSWSGHAAFNDNHVEFRTDFLAHDQPIGLLPSRAKYKSNDAKERPDLWCYDEPDDASGSNNMLGIFTAAGEDRWSFKAIWDTAVGLGQPGDGPAISPW